MENNNSDQTDLSDILTISNITNEIILSKINRNEQNRSYANAKKKVNKIYKNKENIGIICGHGASFLNKICLVPNNLQLFLPTDKGVDFLHGRETDENTFDYLKKSYSLYKTSKIDILNCKNRQGVLREVSTFSV